MYAALHFFVAGQQHFAFANVIRPRDHALLLHFFNYPGGTIIADLQMTLNETSGRFAFTGNESNSLIK